MSWRTELEKLIAPLRHKIHTVISKAIVDTVVNTDSFQVIKVSMGKGELQDGVERIQQYGFTSYPEKDAEAVVAFINGNRNQGIIISVDDSRYRVTSGSEGDVFIYSKGGNHIRLRANGDIDVSAPTGQIKIGDTNLKALVHEDILTAMATHTHVCPSGGGTTIETTYIPVLSNTLHCTKKVTGE